jgi:hypothetical protein
MATATAKHPILEPASLTESTRIFKRCRLEDEDNDEFEDEKSIKNP